MPQNPKFPEGINQSTEHPLKEFFILITAISTVIIVAVICISLLAQSLSRYIPFAWESHIINSVSLENQSTEEHKDDDLKIEQALELLLTKIEGTQLFNPEHKLSIHLLKQDTANAFATLGGHIFVTTGLLKTVSSENALAMVVAHEAAHIEHRHPIQSLSRGAVVQLMLSLIFSDSQAINSILGHAGILTLLSFNRDMEREADKTALLALNKLYGHAKGADEFFQTMLKDNHSDLSLAFFQTHPDIHERIDYLTPHHDQTKLNTVKLVPLHPALILKDEQ